MTHMRNMQDIADVLQTVNEKRWYVKMSKYEFWLREVSFLGHVSYGNEISVNSSKVDAMFAMGRSQHGYENKTFLGLAEYYRRFIKGFIHARFRFGSCSNCT